MNPCSNIHWYQDCYTTLYKGVYVCKKCLGLILIHLWQLAALQSMEEVAKVFRLASRF